MDENHGTAKAMDELGAIPESIPLDISIGTVREQCRLAGRVATASDDRAYRDNTAVWFENGNKVLDYIERAQRLAQAASRRARKNKECRVHRDNLASLLGNMRSLLQSGGIPSERTAKSSSTLTLVDSP